MTTEISASTESFFQPSPQLLDRISTNLDILPFSETTWLSSPLVLADGTATGSMQYQIAGSRINFGVDDVPVRAFLDPLQVSPVLLHELLCYHVALRSMRRLLANGLAVPVERMALLVHLVQ